MIEKLSSFFTARIFSFPGWIDCICFVVSVVALFYQGGGAGIFWKKVLLLIVHLAIVYAALLLFNGIICLVSDHNILVSYFPKLVVLILYLVVFNHYKWQARVILGVLIYALHHVFIELGASLQGICNAKGPGALPEFFRCYTIPLTVLAAGLLRYFNVNKFRIIPLRAVAWSLGYSSIGIILAILRSIVMPYLLAFERTEYYLYGLYPQIYIFVTLICITGFLFACYFFMVRDLQAHEENMELSKRILYKEMNDSLVAINENNLKQLRKIRHEIQNRYAIMQVMLENKEYDRMEAYFKEINNESAVIFSHVDTGNRAFDMVFNLELSKSAAKKIEVATKLIVPPELPVSEMDLSGLIINLMDNAIEACDKIEEGERRIDVSAQVVHSYFVFRISNTVTKENADTALLLETDKPNKELHGYGSKIVDDIVKKYNGQILRRMEDNKFLVYVMLDLDCKNPDKAVRIKELRGGGKK